MKKILLLLIVMVIVISMTAVFTLSSCKAAEEAAEETTEEEAAPTEEEAAPTEEEAVETAEPIKIGSLNHVTGVGAPWGIPMQQVVELAVKEINESGGVLGRQIELIKEDDNTDTDLALQKAKKLIENDKVEAIFGIVWSSIRAAIVTQVADPGKVPLFYPTYNEGGSTLANCSRYYICTGTIPNQQLKEFVPYLMNNYGKKIYLIGVDEVMTTDSWKYIEDNNLVEGHGGTIVGKDVTPWEVGDWSSVLQRVQSSGAEIVFPYIGGSEMINFLKQFHDFGMHETITVASTYLDESFSYVVPEDLREGLLGSAAYFETIDLPRNQEFITAYKDMFGDEYRMFQMTEALYDAVWLWKLAVEKAGVLDKEAMLDALPTVVFNAPQGEVSIDATNNHANLHSYIAECQKDGSFKVIVDLGVIAPESGCNLSE